ncbi:hypothetical protein PI126_g21157 [Phytophthora idaei]|nr:hypothetical protein PI126_g21157 [Phytophthora idaei]
MGDRVLLSTAGIQPSLVTNLGTSKLAPRYIGLLKVTKVLGDAYTLQLPSTIRLRPTFYVGRLRRYHPAVIPSDAGATHQHSLDPPTAARDALPPPAAVPGDAAQHSHAPPGPSAGQDDPEAARSQLPPCGLGPPFQRDGPAPLVDRAGNARYIVESILQHDDICAAPPQGRGVHHRDGDVPPHREYLVRWLGPMPDSWEPRAVLVADVPDCVAAYEASLLSGAGSPRAKSLKLLPVSTNHFALGIGQRRLGTDTFPLSGVGSRNSIPATACAALPVMYKAAHPVCFPRQLADASCQGSERQVLVCRFPSLQHPQKLSAGFRVPALDEGSPSSVKRPWGHGATHRDGLATSRPPPLKQVAHVVVAPRVLEGAVVAHISRVSSYESWSGFAAGACSASMLLLLLLSSPAPPNSNCRLTCQSTNAFASKILLRMCASS